MCLSKEEKLLFFPAAGVLFIPILGQTAPELPLRFVASDWAFCPPFKSVHREAVFKGQCKKPGGGGRPCGLLSSSIHRLTHTLRLCCKPFSNVICLHVGGGGREVKCLPSFINSASKKKSCVEQMNDRGENEISILRDFPACIVPEFKTLRQKRGWIQGKWAPWSFVMQLLKWQVLRLNSPRPPSQFIVYFCFVLPLEIAPQLLLIFYPPLYQTPPPNTRD